MCITKQISTKGHSLFIFDLQGSWRWPLKFVYERFLIDQIKKNEIMRNKVDW